MLALNIFKGLIGKPHLAFSTPLNYWNILTLGCMFCNFFRSILPVVPTESDVLIAYSNIMTKSGSLRNSM